MKDQKQMIWAQVYELGFDNITLAQLLELIQKEIVKHGDQARVESRYDSDGNHWHYIYVHREETDAEMEDRLALAREATLPHRERVEAYYRRMGASRVKRF